jgi:hypothetical protein
MKAIMRSRRPSKVKQTASVMVWARLSIVDDEEMEDDAAAVELDERGVFEIEELVGALWLELSTAVVGVVESRVDNEDEREVATTLEELCAEPYSEVSDATREGISTVVID